MNTFVRRFIILLVWIFFVLCWLAVVPQVQARDSDPNALYGCGDGYRAKSDLVYDAGKTLVNVVGIVVLNCHTADGGGGTFIAPCPVGYPYSYCLRNDNDGAGNHIELGVLELNPVTHPHTVYGGCAAGSGYRKKTSVVLEARPSLRDINAIVVTACMKADGASGTKKVSCSPENDFYLACYKNENDGVGNHVELGVIKIYGFYDVIGQYGGIAPGSGYRSKSVLVTEAGKSLDKVISIVPLFTGMGAYWLGQTAVMPCNYAPIILTPSALGATIQSGIRSS